MVQGRGVDASLNETGKRQAAQAGESFRNVSFDHIFISELKRTRETIDQFINGDIPVTSLGGFDEISWGNQEGKEASYEARNLYADTVNGWRRGELQLNVGGGENPIQVMERQKEAMEEVMKTDASNILICMHGRAMRVLLCWLLNYPLNYMDGFPHHNCSYYVMNYQNDMYQLKKFNEKNHLT